MTFWGSAFRIGKPLREGPADFVGGPTDMVVMMNLANDILMGERGEVWLTIGLFIIILIFVLMIDIRFHRRKRDRERPLLSIVG